MDATLEPLLSTKEPLLSTKLKIPAPRKDYIVRGALFGKITDCTDLSVVFIRGGAGTGKTTLLSTFILETGLHPVCWLSLDASNVNIYSFWLYFSASVSALLEDGESLLNLVRANPGAANLEGILTLLADRLAGDAHIYMVLDDVHRMSDEALLKSFEFFLGIMPDNFHLFMLSREDPAIYLGALAVAGKLLLIEGEQMLLSGEESIRFLTQTLHLQQSTGELERLNAYAEGWVGGLQLAVAAGASKRSSAFFQRTGGGIATEYLNHEIMEALSEEERTFLLKTGICCSFDAELCENLIDGFSVDDFSVMVDGLIRKNLFLICLDEKEMVYRYHNILSDYLAKQFALLPQAQRNMIVQRAAAVFLHRGDVEEALRIYLFVDDYESVLNVALGMSDRIEIWSYLDQVPLDLLAGTPWLVAQCFLYNIGNLNIDQCRALYEMLLLHRDEPEVNRILLFIEPYIKQLDGVLPEYHFVDPDVIEQLPVGDVTKAMMLVENATALVERMEYARAEKNIERAIQINANQNIFVSFFAVMSLAQLYEETGRLEDSLLCYERLLGLMRTPSITPGIAVNYYFGLAGVYLRRMELEKAERTIQEAEARMEGQHLHTDVTDMTVVFHRAEIMFLRGEDEAANAAVELILSDYPEFHILTLGRLLQELSCAGKLPDELARRVVRELAQADRYREQPFWKMLCARISFASGETERSIQEVDEVSKLARLKENRLRMIEADLLKIWMISGRSNADDRRESLNLLREAIHDAHTNRILMPFYLERRTIVPLLMELSAQSSGKHVLPAEDIGLLNELIAICAEPTLPKAPSLLSERELEVLRELATGLTNKEIAAKLCVSTATVKTHIINIFGKLGVSSRLMAAQEARNRGLIL